VIPFNLLLNLNVSGLKIDGYFKLTWMKIRLVQKKFPEKKEKEKKKTEKKEKEEDKERKFDVKKLPKIISLLYESSPYLLRIFNAFLKSTTFKKLSLKLTLGLGSPYDTAIISGYLSALMPLLNLIPNSCFSLEPDLLNERFEVTITLKISIKLLWIVIELLRAIIKKPVRSLLNELRKMR
jgi:hypothetical protein